jgi:hypothetical protein
MKKLVVQLSNNTLTDSEITFAGLDLGKQRVNILGKALGYN